MNILVITYWSYADALIQTALPYMRIIKKQLPSGSKLLMVTLETDDLALSAEIKRNVEEDLRAEGIEWLPLRYVPFGWKAVLKWSYTLFYLGYVILWNKVNVLHCWATPAGAAGYILSVLTGRRLVIDSYEPHAESMTENGTWKKGGMAFRLLFWLEKKQTKRAWQIISATRGMHSYVKQKYGVNIINFHVKPTCVDLNLFSRKNLKDTTLLQQLKLTDKIVGVYAGKLGGIYLDHEVFDFVKVAADYWGDSFRFLLMTNQSQELINDYCLAAGVNPSVVVLAFVDHGEVPRYLGLADFAVTPVKPVPSKRYCSPIKDGEYWAMGLPVVIPDHISDDSEIIRTQSIGFVLKDLNRDEYQAAIGWIHQFLRLPRQESFDKIRSVAIKYRNFAIAEMIYKKIYNG